MLNIALSLERQAPSKRLRPTPAVKVAAFLASLFFGYPAQSESINAVNAAALYDAQTTYSIYRKGKTIGQHSLNFKTSNTQVQVAIESKISISVLKIPVFKFRYVSDEVWQDNQLISVNSTTTTNKEIEKATLTNSGNSSTLVSNDTSEQVPLINFASNHWHMGAVDQSVLFNTVKGTLANVNVQRIDNESLQIRGTTLSVTHIKYSGDIVAEAWYDKNSRWVKLEFLGSDGSRITYLIDNP